jgi:hypothetical protein
VILLGKCGMSHEVFRWLGLVILPLNLFFLFDCLSGAALNKKLWKGFWLIWHASIWLTWRDRNEVIFANGISDPKEVVNEIKVMSWRWGLGRIKSFYYFFYEWCWDPGSCLIRS